MHANVVTTDKKWAKVRPEASLNGFPKSNQWTITTIYHDSFKKTPAQTSSHYNAQQWYHLLKRQVKSIRLLGQQIKGHRSAGFCPTGRLCDDLLWGSCRDSSSRDTYRVLTSIRPPIVQKQTLTNKATLWEITVKLEHDTRCINRHGGVTQGEGLSLTPVSQQKTSSQTMI